MQSRLSRWQARGIPSAPPLPQTAGPCATDPSARPGPPVPGPSDRAPRGQRPRFRSRNQPRPRRLAVASPDARVPGKPTPTSMQSSAQRSHRTPSAARHCSSNQPSPPCHQDRHSAGHPMRSSQSPSPSLHPGMAHRTGKSSFTTRSPRFIPPKPRLVSIDGRNPDSMEAYHCQRNASAVSNPKQNRTTP